jgi:glycosyltransferase involved in cell wall biosynthesis
MRIVLLSPDRAECGASVSAIELCRGLVERGHDTTVVCHPRSFIAERLAADPRLTVAPLAIGTALNPARVWQMARIVRRAQPDIVLADDRTGLHLGIAARRLAGRFPIVHRLPAADSLEDSRVDRYLWRRELQALILDSHTIRERVLEVMPWLKDVRLDVIRAGKNTTLYRPLPKLRQRMREELGIPEDAFVVSHHGSLQAESHVDLLVRAVAELPRHLEVLALIVGVGPLLAETRRLATKLRAPVIFTGNRTDIPEVLSAADVAAHLSTGEGSSNSIIEALACGLPVVASDSDRHREQIEDSAHGVLVPTLDWNGVADALRWLAADAEERERMSGAARERAVRDFALTGMIDRYEEVLAQIIEVYETEQGPGPDPAR